MKAFWNGQLLAESDDTVVVENNHYFPLSSLDMAFFKPSQTTSHCGWKGTANYYTIQVGEQENVDAAWYYEAPKQAAKQIKGHAAFWRGVNIVV